MNAPTLFVLAADLTRMQVVANIDESDVGRIRPGQSVSFQVDAYPSDRFTGTVSQVRLQPTVVQNVVTYSTVITVPNLQLKLKPGMTANVTIEIVRRNDVLRVANAAMRFRPTAEMFSVLNQPAPAELQRTGTGARGGRARTDGGSPSSAAQAQRSAPAAPPAAAAPATPARTAASKATTIDALFAPLTTTESRGMVWQYDGNKQLKAVRLRLGSTDGTFTEVLNEADVPADAQIVTAMKTGLEPAAKAATGTPSGNPLMGGGPPGGRGGGGRGF